MTLMLDDVIRPTGVDKTGPIYSTRELHDVVVKMVNTKNFFKRKGKKMSTDYDKATDIINKAQSRFDTALIKLKETEAEISKTTKKVSENVRSSTERLSQGLARIEKQANFERLETYVNLLERAEQAITSLAHLQETGKLEKIANAIS